MNDNINGEDILLEMRKKLESIRIKKGYDINKPFSSVRNKNTLTRIMLSIGIVIIIVALVAVGISIVALQNAGHPLDFSFLNR